MFTNALRITTVLLCALSLSGCSVALLAGPLNRKAKSDGEKASFDASLVRINADRAKAHQPPLDWCSETYKWDPGWAMDNAECAKRVERFEAGDRTALDP